MCKTVEIGSDTNIFVNTPSYSQIVLLFQFAGEMSNSHMYKFPQNNLYSYNMIANSLRKIHILENREKITVQTCKLKKKYNL
jgi:hypothetical protein